VVLPVLLGGGISLSRSGGGLRIGQEVLASPKTVWICSSSRRLHSWSLDSSMNML
jgi:hypothetical protein